MHMYYANNEPFNVFIMSKTDVWDSLNIMRYNSK